MEFAWQSELRGAAVALISCAFERCQEDQLSVAVPCQNTIGMLIITVSHIVQDPASGLFYWIIVCLERGKYPLLEANCLMVCVVIKGDQTSMETVSLFSCKVAASLSVGFIKKACVLVVLWQR